MTTSFECPAAVAACHAAIRRDPAAALAAAAQARAALHARGIEGLGWEGWPLRPFFVPRARLAFLVVSLQKQLNRLRRGLAKLADDPASLAAATGLDVDFWAAIDRAPLRRHLLAEVWRPDGYWSAERYVIGEPNVGNGLVVSMGGVEMAADAAGADPMLAALGFDAAGIARPFAAYAAWVRRKLGRGPGRRRVALLAHALEWAEVASWPKRVHDQLNETVRHLAVQGLDAVVVVETELSVGRDGWPRRTGDPLPFHGIVGLTDGACFIEESARFATELRDFAGPRMGRAPILLPLAGLALEKNALPFWHQLGPWPVVAPDGFAVDLADTRFPAPADAAMYRRERAEWVFKRASYGKDTYIGLATDAALWDRVIAHGLATKDFVAQRHQPLPTAVVPISPDGQRIEWVEVNHEVSPFLIGGAYAGAAVRYAPTQAGLVFSPPPEGMGFGTLLPV